MASFNSCTLARAIFLPCILLFNSSPGKGITCSSKTSWALFCVGSPCDLRPHLDPVMKTRSVLLMPRNPRRYTFRCQKGIPTLMCSGRQIGLNAFDIHEPTVDRHYCANIPCIWLTIRLLSIAPSSNSCVPESTEGELGGKLLSILGYGLTCALSSPLQQNIRELSTRWYWFPELLVNIVLVEPRLGADFLTKWTITVIHLRRSAFSSRPASSDTHGEQCNNLNPVVGQFHFDFHQIQEAQQFEEVNRVLYTVSLLYLEWHW